MAPHQERQLAAIDRFAAPAWTGGLTGDAYKVNIRAMTPTRRAQPAGRRNIPEKTKRLVWVRAGGCCEMCGRYLLEGELTAIADTLGELAHIVGQGEGPGSPRGQVEMSEEERDSADNLMLVCPNEHDEIDRDGALDAVTIERLRERKREHEAHIRRLVTMDQDRRSAVLRVIGQIDNDAVQVPRNVAAEAVLGSGRIAAFPFSFDQQGIEIDLRGLPGNPSTDENYWASATLRIDEVIDGRLVDGVTSDAVQHVSLFAFARLPLLVYLGAKLGDTFPVEVFQRRRADQRWGFADGPTVEFQVDRPAKIDAEDAVLVLSISGTIDISELPAQLRAMPRIVVSPVAVDPNTDVIESKASLQAFEFQVRRLLAQLEAPDKVVRRLHVIGALPMSAAVALGRAHSAPVHPELVVYQRVGNTYVPAVTVR